MKITNKLNLPHPFVSACNTGYEYKDKQYSVTTLLKGVREIILARKYDHLLVEDVADRIWAIFGNAVHQILENAEATSTQIKENKLKVAVDDYTLSGIFDLYDSAFSKVTDYKTGSVWKIIYDEWEDYRTQLLAYAWMLEKNGFKCDKGEIVLILKDWKRNEFKRNPSQYPEHPVYKKEFNFTEFDFIQIENLIKEKFLEIKNNLNVDDDKLPLCSEKERWHKPGKKAVMKKGRKSAVKLFDDIEEANKYLLTLDNQHFIEERPGTDGKCVDYCSVCKYCNYWKENYENNSESQEQE